MDLVSPDPVRLSSNGLESSITAMIIPNTSNEHANASAHKSCGLFPIARRLIRTVYAEGLLAFIPGWNTRPRSLLL